MPLIRLYRSSDLLVKHRERIEAAVFAQAQDLFELQATVTLYDLTNTYVEGSAAANPKAARGRSKEKRSDCPLLTLGLVRDGSGVCSAAPGCLPAMPPKAEPWPACSWVSAPRRGR